MGTSQDKAKEIEFFDSFSKERSYNVFTDASSVDLVRRLVEQVGFAAGGRVGDLGCGSGAFTDILRSQGFAAFGLDISHGLLVVGRREYPGIPFITGDVEHLPFADNSLDGVLLSGIVHHFPDPAAFAAEVHRVLKPGAGFAAFDPNRLNPFMYLLRDRSSPFYSSKGVTENERPVLPGAVRRTFENAGFRVRTEYLSGIRYRYVAMGVMRYFLPLYNCIDATIFTTALFRRVRAFVLTSGVKQ
ncbi:MAG: class I SAM-dependent methyltransferase [Desulfovibrionaceae bacterium]